MTKKISLIIPAKNEVESLETVLLEVNKNFLIGEIIIIVDSEFDNSVAIAKKFNCKLVIQKNNGYGSAIIEGFKNANNEWVAVDDVVDATKTLALSILDWCELSS